MLKEILFFRECVCFRHFSVNRISGNRDFLGNMISGQQNFSGSRIPRESKFPGKNLIFPRNRISKETYCTVSKIFPERKFSVKRNFLKNGLGISRKKGAGISRKKIQEFPGPVLKFLDSDFGNGHPYIYNN